MRLPRPAAKCTAVWALGALGALFLSQNVFGSADGINLMNTGDARIDHVFVSATDDAMCLKARNFDGPQDPDPARNVRNVITSNAVIYQSGYRATKIGTETAAELFENILYENIFVARAGANMANSAYLTDSGELRNFVYRNYYAPGNHWNANMWGFRGREPQPSARIHQFTLRNIVCDNLRFSGHSGSDYPISDCSVTNFRKEGSLVTDKAELDMDEYVEVESIGLDVNPVYALDFIRPIESSLHLLPEPLYIKARVRHEDDLPMTVEFFADGESIGTASEAPHAIEWEAPEGWHHLTYTVSDSSGNTDSLATPRRVEVRSEPVFSDIRIFPGSAEFGSEQERQFTARALDQYGETFYPQPSELAWSADGGGTFADSESGRMTTGSGNAGPQTVRVSATIDGVTVEGTGTFTVGTELAAVQMSSVSGEDHE